MSSDREVSESTSSHVELDREAVDDALEQLESAMKAGKMALSHDEVRPSTDQCARRARDGYNTLVEAHPDYDLVEGGSE